MKNMKKNSFRLALAALVTVPALATLGCGHVDKISKESMISQSNVIKASIETKASNSWTDKLINPGVVSRTWDGDTSFTIDDMLTQMNSQMQYDFLISIDKMTPYQLGMYLVNFYNNNGGAIFDFKVSYQGKVDNVNIDYSQKLYELISSFEGVTPATVKVQGSIQSITADLATKIGGPNVAAAIFDFFAQYGQDVFDMNIGQLALMILTNSATSPEQLRAYEILKLLDALPTEAIQNFPSVMGIFSLMGAQFKSSAVAQEWAKDRGLTFDFNKIDHTLIYTIMHSGN